MSQQMLPTLLSATLFVLVSSCSSSDGTSVLPQSATSDINRPLIAQPASVFDTFIAPARTAAHPANNATNLLNNADFENEAAFWSSCRPSSVSASSDAYLGDEALFIDSTSCLYQVVEAQPGESYSFSCFVKLTELDTWTGLGMTFSDSDYQSVATAPSATATSGEYTQIETAGVAPADTAFVGVWIYSDHGALVDNCALTLEADRNPVTPSTDENLLLNANFSAVEENNQAVSWLSGCGNSVIADGSSLYISDSSCADQALSAEAIAALDNRTSTYSCAVAAVDGYSDLSVFFDNTLVANKQITPVDIGQRVSLSVPANSSINGFVSLYSEGNLRVENCALVADGDITSGTPSVPSTPSAPATPAAPAAPTAPTVPATPAAPTPPSEPTNTPVPVEPAEPVDPVEPAEPVNNTPVTARYRVTFNATWSEATHPVNFPAGNPHFSPLTGVTHNDQVQFWAPQVPASQGVKVVAETGNPTEFLNEINAVIRNGDAAVAITGGGIPLSPGSTSVEFDISSDFPLVTLATMIAPSPDWFLGVHDLSMLENGDFVESMTVSLNAYDAGTDSGVTYTSADLATTPVTGITLVNSDLADSSFQAGLPPAGELVFERLQ